jgi:hypothetical protein
MQLAALDDLNGPAARVGDDLCHLGSLVASISEDALDEGERAACRAKQVTSAVAILQMGGMDYDAQQEAERIDEDMALATRDLLAGIKALRVERRAPFCAALALWLSMIAAVGLASRPTCSRAST